MFSPQAWLAVAWSLFQLYTAYAGMFDLLVQLPIHVAFAVALGFLTPPGDARPGPWRRWLDGGAAMLTLACAAHFVAHNERLASRMALVDDPRRLDVIVSVLFVALLLEASRRHIGSALVTRSLAAMQELGYAAAELGVDADSPTGAGRLYARLGFEVFARDQLHSRAL